MSPRSARAFTSWLVTVRPMRSVSRSAALVAPIGGSRVAAVRAAPRGSLHSGQTMPAIPFRYQRSYRFPQSRHSSRGSGGGGGNSATRAASSMSDVLAVTVVPLGGRRRSGRGHGGRGSWGLGVGVFGGHADRLVRAVSAVSRSSKALLQRRRRTRRWCQCSRRSGSPPIGYDGGTVSSSSVLVAGRGVAPRL